MARSSGDVRLALVLGAGAARGLAHIGVLQVLEEEGRQAALSALMAGPEVLVEPEVGDISLREFHRLDEAIEAGRRAAGASISEIRRALSDAFVPPPRAEMELTLRFDPVCNMVVSPRRARASLWHGGKRYYFCSSDCLQAFTASHDRAPKGQPAEGDHPVTM